MPFDLAILAGTTPADDLAAAEQVEVSERIGEPSTFRLRYRLVDVDQDYPLLLDGRLAPGAALTVAARAGDDQAVLVKGQVHGHRVNLMRGVGTSSVEVCGGDTCFEMDREIKTKLWTGVTASDAVSSVLSSYGVTADVDSLSTKHTDDTHPLVQRDTDLRFVRRLAVRYGHWFWMSTDVAGVTTAHFKRPALSGPPVATVGLDDDPATLDSLEIEWAVERPTAAIGLELKLADLSTLDGQVARTPLPPLGGVAYADIAAPREVQITANVDDLGDLQARAEAALIDGGWFVRASGRANARAVGTVLRPHTVIAVSGLGTRHSGKYVVAAVRHTITGDSHLMDFELLRNAWEA